MNIQYKQYKDTDYYFTKYGTCYRKIDGELTLVKPSLVSGGYLQLKLYTDSGMIRDYAHRMVLTLFDREPNENETANHKDGDKLNNYIGNLQWTTPSENIKHALANGLMKPRINKSRVSKKACYLTDDEVFDIRRLAVISEMTQRELAERFNTTQPNVSKIINGVNRGLV